MMFYEDPAAQLFFQPGAADHLVITFSNLATRADKVRFWGDKPLRHLGIPALGIVARRPHWFVDGVMQGALEAALPRMQGHTDRVAYGFSMGAYGAIRHARRLGVRTVIAFSPQWTIDPAAMAGQPQPFAAHFQAEDHAGMELTTFPVAARLYLLHDPQDRVDAWHAARVAERIPQTVRISIPFVGHGSMRPFTSTPAMGALIEAARSHDDGLVRRMAREARRAEPSRAILLASHVRDRHFELAQALFAHGEALAPPNLQARTRIELAQRALEIGMPERAWALAEPAIPLVVGAKGLTRRLHALLADLGIDPATGAARR
jgi:hypothetical protein